MKIKKKVALSGLLLCCAITAKAQVCITPQVEQRARELVSQMTLEEKIDYISGLYDWFLFSQILFKECLSIRDMRQYFSCHII